MYLRIGWCHRVDHSIASYGEIWIPESTNLTAWSLASVYAPIKPISFISKKHAMESKEKYLKATETILESTYMDDSIDSAPSDKE